MIVYEVLATGVPLIAYPQEQNLIPEMAYFAASGCLINLGHDGGEDLDKITAAVNRLLRDRHKALAIAARGNAMVDGLGLSRAAALIDALMPT